MSEDNPEDINRRQLLKRTAGAASAALIGGAAVTGNASANVTADDYVEVRRDWSATYSTCWCQGEVGTPSSCGTAWRSQGERGRAVGAPDGDCSGSGRWLVRWDDWSGDQEEYSWIGEENIHVISRG